MLKLIFLLLICSVSKACIDSKDCSYRGECSADKSSCICYQSFTTLVSNSSIQCNYRKPGEINQRILSYLPIKYNFEQVSTSGVIDCKGPISCSNNGNCSADLKTCICDDEYTTVPADNYPQCNYEMSSQKDIFIIQLITGWCTGAGMWKIGKYNIAIGQIILFWGGLLVVGILTWIFACLRCGACVGKFCCRMVILVFVAAFAWNIIIWAQILKNDLYDSNGVPLYTW